MNKRIVPMVLVILVVLVVFFYNKANETNDTVNKVIVSKSNDDSNKEDLKSEESLEGQVKQEDNEKGVELINIPIDEVQVPILMYHSISDTDSTNNLLVPPDMFEEQIKWLKDNGFTAILLDDLLEAMETGNVPKRPVVITFDDGYVDNYTDAYETLKKYNMKATFFIITDNVDKDSGYMNLVMLKEMKDFGMAIENHTSNHLELNKLSKSEQISSIKDGQDFLRNTIGVEGRFLCYPVGRYNDTTIEVAQELGIKAAVTTESGISSLSDGLYQLKRLRISPMSLESFSQIFSEFIE